MTNKVTAADVRRAFERRNMPTAGVDFEKLADVQNNRAGRSVEWDAPRVLPADWRETQRLADGASYVNAAKRLRVIVSCSREEDGREWLHFSCSHAVRLPTWGEFRDAKEVFLGDREAYQVMPPMARYVNLQPHVLHLFALLDEAAPTALPDFTGGTGSI